MILQLTQAVKKILLLSCMVAGITLTSNAQTTLSYTAVANGNFTSTTTWQGGTVPPFITGGTVGVIHHIIIPSGITVTLDTNLNVKNGPGTGQGRLTVDGTLNGQAGYYLNLASSLIGTNSGVINVDSINIGGVQNGYNGTITVNYGRLNNLYTNGNSTINIGKRLTLPWGTDSHIFGTINYSNGTHIIREGGSWLRSNSGGTQNFAGKISLTLRKLHDTRDNYDIDTLWMSQNIDTLIIDVDSNILWDKVTNTASLAHKDYTFNGTMIIRSGSLALNDHKLTFGPDAKLYCTPYWGMVRPTKNSEIVINATSDMGGGFYFYVDTLFNVVDDTIKNFTMNMGNSNGVVRFYNQLIVNNNLNLTKGQIDLVNAQLKMQTGSTATITNAGPDSYVKTSTFGSGLHMDIASNGTKTFPLGTGGHYAPITIKNTNTATSSDVYRAGMVAFIQDSVTKGLSVSNGEPCVRATWWAEKAGVTYGSADITLMWPSAMEVNSFDRTMSYVSRYDHSAQEWDTQPSPTAASTQGSFYTHTESVTNFNTSEVDYFAVFDSHTSLSNLSVSNLAAKSQATLYPNPTSGYATLSLNINKAQTIAITITDLSGRVVYTNAATLYTSGQHSLALPTSNLQAGTYLLQLTNEQGTVLNSGKLLKQ